MRLGPHHGTCNLALQQITPAKRFLLASPAQLNGAFTVLARKPGPVLTEFFFRVDKAERTTRLQGDINRNILSFFHFLNGRAGWSTREDCWVSYTNEQFSLMRH